MPVSPFDRDQTRQALQALKRAAYDAHQAGQLVAEEALQQQILVLAAQLDDLPALICARHGLAEVWRLLGRQTQALPLYVGLIDLATDPAQYRAVADDHSRHHVASAFLHFVSCGRSVPHLPTTALLRVIAAGRGWLEQIDRPQWAARFRMEQGQLYARQGRWDAARQELGAGLALRRRAPQGPGYTLASHLLSVAHLRRREEVGAYAEAAVLAEEVLQGSDPFPGTRCQAYGVLVYTGLAGGNVAGAEAAAAQAEALAQAMQSPRTRADVYEMRGRLARATGRVRDAVHAAASRYQAARAHACFQCTFEALLDGAWARLLQAQQAAGLAPPARAALPAGRPLAADPARVRGYLASAQRFLDRVAPLAAQWDAAAGVTAEQSTVARLRAEVAALAPLGPPP